MFQIGRSKESQIDFVVMDTPPPPKAIIDEMQQTAHQHDLERFVNRRHSNSQPGQQPQQQRNGEFRSGISRYACRLIVERQPQPSTDSRQNNVEASEANPSNIHKIAKQGDRSNLNQAESDDPKTTACVNEWTVRVFAAGFDSSSNIFLGENASAWQGAGGSIDGLTTNGVLLMQPMGAFGELPATAESTQGVPGAAGVWREVSVAGGIYGLRESRAARRAGPRIAEEDNVLCDGALIDLCGATLLFRSARGLCNSPTRADLLEEVRAKLD